jgi:hypothetical protein
MPIAEIISYKPTSGPEQLMAAFTQSAAGYEDERRRRPMELHTIGIDLGKTVFHLVGVNLRGEVVVGKKFSRKQLLHFTANLQIQLIGMEACGGAHFLMTPG